MPTKKTNTSNSRNEIAFLFCFMSLPPLLCPFFVVPPVKALNNIPQNGNNAAADAYTSIPPDPKGLKVRLKFTDKQKVSAIKKREFRLTKSDEEKLLLALDKHPNPDFKRIVLLALFTAMRRSEIVTLTWAQIKENYIQLKQRM